MKYFSSLRYAKRAGLTGCRLAALVLAANVGLLGAAQAQADSGWLWLDGSGRQVFSDMPPPADVPAKNIRRQPATVAAPIQPSTGEGATAGTPAATAGPATGQTGTSSSLNQPAGPSQALSDAQLRAAVEKRNAEIRQQNCQQARAALATLESGQPLLTTDAKGEQVLLGNEARAAETRRLRQAEQDNCKPPAAAQAR